MRSCSSFTYDYSELHTEWAVPSELHGHKPQGVIEVRVYIHAHWLQQWRANEEGMLRMKKQ